LFLAKYFSERELLPVEFPRASAPYGLKERDWGPFSESGLSGGGHLPVVRCGWAGAARFRETLFPS
jgi:hypothetical protein